MLPTLRTSVQRIVTIEGFNGIGIRLLSNSTPETVSSKRLKGKVALTTASTDGIGLAIAERLAAEGADVVISSRNSENVEKAVNTLKELGYSVLGLPCHVSNENERKNIVETTLDTYGGIDIFISNAAVNPLKLPVPEGDIGGVLGCSEEVWDKIFEVNLKNTWQMTQLIAPHMQKRKSGSIINVSSIGAFNPPDRVVHTYSVSKVALLGLTKVLAKELVDSNIRVNCICPGVINTKFIKSLLRYEKYRKIAYGMPLMKRLGEPDEISGVAAFLCSDDAKYITGENIVVAGGAMSRL